jgi:hypothetical protein
MKKRLNQIVDGFFIGTGIVIAYNLNIFINNFLTFLTIGSK